MAKPQPSSSKVAAAPPTEDEMSMSAPKSSEEKVEDLERRLAALGGEGAGEEKEEQTTPTPADEPAAVGAPAVAAKKPTKKDALLARIMAAQERAKHAQQQQQKEAPAAETTKSDDPPPPFDLLNDTPPPPIESVPPPAVAPPPCFDAVEHTLPTKQQQEDDAIAPPAYQEMQDEAEPAAAPSAPPLLDLHHNHEHTLAEVGIERLVPPPAEEEAPPPSFEEFQQTSSETAIDEEAFMLDEDGNALSPEQRKAMIEEQRRIMEQIQKESADNAAAIAAARAESFDQRSGTAVAAAAGPSTQPTPVATAAAATETHEAEGEEAPRRTVEIGNGQHVALHGQNRTKKAIAAGTAILVQCINCQNWMQVTDTATLMFCPVCQVVSPVIKQTEVMTKEEAVQLTLDRKMAERLQNAEYAEDGEAAEENSGGATEEEVPGLLARLTGSNASTYPAEQQQHRVTASQAKSESWGEWFSSMMGSEQNKHRSAEIAVARPPTATASNTSLRLVHSAAVGTERPSISATSTQDEDDNEREGLLVSNAATRNMDHLPSARVAQSKPLFSCVADSVLSVTNAVSGALTTQNLDEDDEGNVHGVDASSLLVTTAGRSGGDGGGDYRSVPGDA